METVKEKLTELIEQAERKNPDCGIFPYILAEELAQNGVTIQECGMDCKNCWKTKLVNPVQEWVSVDERLPEESLNSVIGWDEYRERCVFVQYYKGEWILGDHESVKITHWMPLPAPPKGVQ